MRAWLLATFDRATGRMFLGDVGQDRCEETDVVEAGKNSCGPTCASPPSRSSPTASSC
ncbi:MAG: hypothetical protein ACK45F_03495 [bacterium]